MKKVFIVLACLIVLLLAALITAPFFLKGPVARIIERQTSRHMTAQLNIGSLDLSMFKNFPYLQVGVKDITVTGKNEFAGDTLAYIPVFRAAVNVVSLIKGDEISVHRILVRDAQIQAIVTKEGKKNWDIFPTDMDTLPPASPNEKADFADNPSLEFKQISIEHLSFHFKDEEQSTTAGTEDINLHMSGNFSGQQSGIDLNLTMENLWFREKGTTWVNNADVKWQARLSADFQNQTYEIEENTLSINELLLHAEGKVSSRNKHYEVDLRLSAPDTRFASLLALVPKSFGDYTRDLKTDGSFTLDMQAKGEWYKNHLPKLDLHLGIKDASVQYAGLPEAIQDINLELNINNPGGPSDSTRVIIHPLSFQLGGNPFSASLSVINPASPFLHGEIEGKLNFGDLKKVLPFQELTLAGMLTTHVKFEGLYRYLEEKGYDKFQATGSFHVQDLSVKNSTFPEGIAVTEASVNVTPSALDVQSFRASLGSTNFSLKGKISHYLPYLFKGETLKGNFSLSSSEINLNEFIYAKNGKQTTPGKTDSIKEPALIPHNLDLRLATNIQTLQLEGLTASHISGELLLKQGIASVKDLKMNLLNGSATLNGSYSTVVQDRPSLNFRLNTSNLDIHSAYQAFPFIRQNLPIAVNCQGQISTSLNLAAQLDCRMKLLPTSLNGSGSVSSSGIVINENPAMDKLAGFLKNEELSRLSISRLKIDFDIQDGDITVKPFQTTLAGNPATIYGRQTVNGELDYTLSVKADRKFFGKDINQLLKSIPGSDHVKSLEIGIQVEGTLSKPEIKPDISKALKSLQKEAEKELKKKARKGLLDGLDKLFK